MKRKTFSVIGGDARQFYLAEAIARDGFLVKLFGFDKFEIQPEGFLQVNSLSEAVNADFLILPLPCFKDDTHVFSPFCSQDIKISDILSLNLKDKIIFGGKISDCFIKNAEELGCTVYDYLKFEELAIMNAVPTAEGAIASAVEETVGTIFESACLVTGFGRIGKLLAKYLKSLGAEVFVSARKESDLAYIKANGYTPLKTDSILPYLHRFDIIFNTVPHVIFKRQELKNLKRDAVIIELASSPYGVDFDTADELGIKVFIKGGLPGKTAPKKSGEIIWNTIQKITKGG